MKRLIICLCFLLPQTLLADDRWDEAVVDLIIKAHSHSDKVTEEPLQDYLEKYWLSESCNRAWDEEYRNCMRGINILKPKSMEN